MPYISTVLARLLAAAGVHPSELDDPALRRAEKRQVHLPLHPLTCRIQATTGVVLVRLDRTKGRALIKLDQDGVIHQERADSGAGLVWPGELPGTVRAAAAGSPVSALADLGPTQPFIGPEIVHALVPSWSGSTAAELRPTWIMAERHEPDPGPT